jgi:hypothetical protein
MDGYMSMQGRPRKSPASQGKSATSTGAAGLRRRIVFELTVEELPLMDVAEARHGSKRAALLAALASLARAEELECDLIEAKHLLAAQGEQGERAAEAADRGGAKLARDLKSAQAALARGERELAEARAASERSMRETAEAREEYEASIEDRDEEIAELAAQAFEHLFCARCGSWVGPDEWAQAPAAGDGACTYHERCGDHGSSILGGPSSWLGHQRP